MQQIVLQFLQPRLGALPLGQVAHKAGEQPLFALIYLANRQLHRKRAAILAQPDHDAADADDPSLTRAQVARQIGIMLFAIG